LGGRKDTSGCVAGAVECLGGIVHRSAPRILLICTDMGGGCRTSGSNCKK